MVCGHLTVPKGSLVADCTDGVWHCPTTIWIGPGASVTFSGVKPALSPSVCAGTELLPVISTRLARICRMPGARPSRCSGSAAPYSSVMAGPPRSNSTTENPGSPGTARGGGAGMRRAQAAGASAGAFRPAASRPLSAVSRWCCCRRTSSGGSCPRCRKWRRGAGSGCLLTASPRRCRRRSGRFGRRLSCRRCRP